MLLVVVAIVGGATTKEAVAARKLPSRGRGTPARVSRVADAPASSGRSTGSTPAAPSGPPLSGTGAPASAGGGEEGSSPGELDPLVSNGLGSPLCEGALGRSELSAASVRNCETSGFVAARATTGGYGIDVHIDTGLFGLSSGVLQSIVQDMFVAPVWMALTWAVHALVVMLEWCFTIDLLDSASVGGGVVRGLRQMQQAFTDPWLATVLAVASLLALYHGVIRRRVADTLGQALLALAMIVGGTWVMLDPTGTVGALGRWANEAGLGTLAVTTRGTPADAGGALADSMSTVFDAAIEVPWCYLEFGDVGWCRDPARLNPRLRAAGLKIASGELAQIGCSVSAAPSSSCISRGSGQAKALEHSAQLLREARSNGAVFLALPANGSDRNSINDPASLLRVICQSSDASKCRGPAAAEAEFRTNGGTWARVGGLLLIVIGVFGMLLLLGFIALRLLAAALFSLLYLMLAPAAVLAPALGESGRALFRGWAGQLLAAVVSKLLFSFLLGVVLAILAILANLEALGWWTQWLLMCAFWWGAYARRHQALGLAGSALGRDHRGSQQTVAQRISGAFDSPRKAINAGRARHQRSKQPPGEQRRGPPAATAAGGASTPGGEQAERTLAHDRREARARLHLAPAARQRLSTMRSQLQRVRAEQAKALTGGDRRRAALLDTRARRLEGGIGREQHELYAAGPAAAGHEHAGSWAGPRGAHELQERNRFLDAQAALPAAAHARGLSASERRDYAAMAGLAGYGRREYERLEASERRAVRLQIDRELAARGAPGSSSAQDVRHDREPAIPSAGTWRSAADARSRPTRARYGPDAASQSSVMRDAREVASGRKRQLGVDRR